ncbi:MAG: hypothetical protein F6K41_13830 [Symploca sp. SIO3E6]|nr:hypothetical protein [Caldora sp. SIO3E6]
MIIAQREKKLFLQQLGGSKSGSELDSRGSGRPPTFEDPPEPTKEPTSRPMPDETFVEPKPIEKTPSSKPTRNYHDKRDRAKNQRRWWQKIVEVFNFPGSTEHNLDTSWLLAVANDGMLDHQTTTVNSDTPLNTPVQSDTPKNTVIADGTDVNKVCLEMEAVVSMPTSTPPYPVEETETATPIAELVLQDVEIDFTESDELQFNTAVEEEQFVADAVLDEILVESDRLEALNSDDNPSLDDVNNREIINISLQETNEIVAEQPQTEQATEPNVAESQTNENTNQGDSSVLEEEPQVPVAPPISEEESQVPVAPPISEEEPQVPVAPPISEEKPQVPIEPPISEEEPQVPVAPPISEEEPQVPIEPPISEEEPPDKTDDNIIDASGGNKTIVVEAGEKVVITNFTGIGTGTNPSQTILEELDTVQFIGEGLAAKSLRLRQEGEDVLLSFEGDTSGTTVVLQGVQLEDIDNIPFNEEHSVFVGNIIFNDDVVMEDSFDVFDAESNHQSVFRLNTVTFLNDLDNHVQGFDDSEDVINAGEGNDRLEGLSGNDILRGEAGNDTLLGGLGDDILVGGSGDDLLNGGSGSNTYTGGAGNDQFILSEVSSNVITDFTSGEDQLILADNLPINDLQITLGTSSDNGSSTIISSPEGHILAILSDVHPDSISQSDFGFLNDTFN